MRLINTSLNSEALPAVTDRALLSAAEGAVNREPSTPASPAAQALRDKLSALRNDGNAQEIKELAVLIDFYDARASAPLWVTPNGLTPEAVAIINEIRKADAPLEGKRVNIFVNSEVADLLFDEERQGVEQLERELGVQIEITVNNSFHQEQFEVEIL